MDYSSVVRVATLTIIVTACGQANSQSAVGELIERGELRLAQTSVSSGFGDSVLGMPIWLSGNGRTAALLRFVEDTDGNGRIEAIFGHHGEMLGDEPQVWVYDIATGQGTRYDEILLGDPNDRYLAIRAADTILVLDTETGTHLDLTELGILLESDQNRCHAPRQLTFDPEGEHVAFLRGSPARLVIRSLTSGAEREIGPTSGELWRAAFAETRGWIFLHEVDGVRSEDEPTFPRQRTSCVSALYSIFASSYSFGEWDGPEFRTFLIAPDGSRRAIDSPTAVPVGERAYVQMPAKELFTSTGEPIGLPADCGEFVALPGGPTVLLECSDGQRLFDPASGRQIPLSRKVYLFREGVAVRDARGRLWAPVEVALESMRDRPRNMMSRLHPGRLRLDDGRLEIGPPVHDVEPVGGPWLFGIGSERGFPVDVRTGEIWEVPLGGFRWIGSALVVYQERGPPLALFPARGIFLEAPPNVGAFNDNGCFIEADSLREHVQQGPWVRRCMVSPDR